MASRKTETAAVSPEMAAASESRVAVQHAALAQDATTQAARMMDRADREKYEVAMKARQEADERARESEVKRIKLLTGDDDPDLLWVMSNRVDDRVALFERDDRHPGGEAFIAGSAPDHVFRTPPVAAKLNSGEIVEVPEPKAGPKRPLALAAANVGYRPQTQPGEAVRLGRVPDPDLFDAEAKSEIMEAQADKPDEIPVPAGVVVPPPVGGERESSRR